MAGWEAAEPPHIQLDRIRGLLFEAATEGRLGGSGKTTVVSIFPRGCIQLQSVKLELEEFVSMTGPDTKYPSASASSPDFHMYCNLVDAKAQPSLHSCMLHGGLCTGNVPKAGVDVLLGHAKVGDGHETLAPFFADIVRHIDVFSPNISLTVAQNVRAGALFEERAKRTVKTLLHRDVLTSNVTLPGFSCLVLFVGNSAKTVQAAFSKLCSSNSITTGSSDESGGLARGPPGLFLLEPDDPASIVVHANKNAAELHAFGWRGAFLNKLRADGDTTDYAASAPPQRPWYVPWDLSRRPTNFTATPPRSPDTRRRQSPPRSGCRCLRCRSGGGGAPRGAAGGACCVGAEAAEPPAERLAMLAVSERRRRSPPRSG